MLTLFFLIGGRAHFTSTEFLHEHRATICRDAADDRLMVLTVCVTPASVYMWLNPQLFSTFGETFLAWRLVAQVVLIACIWWSTRPDTAGTPDLQEQATRAGTETFQHRCALL